MLLFGLLLNRPYYSAIFSMSGIQAVLLWRILSSFGGAKTRNADFAFERSSTIAVAYLVMFYLGKTGYFALGNSNSIASIDLAAGETGLSEQLLAASFVMVWFSTFSLPLTFGVWGMSAVLEFPAPEENRAAATAKQRPSKHEEVRRRQLEFGTFAWRAVVGQSLFSSGFLGVAYLMRNHLFVWSVFSPKVVYEIGWMMVAAIKTVIAGLVLKTVQK
jgi:ethanolaminephosphotransferase